MNIRRVIQERLRAKGAGVDVESDVNAVVAANVGERGAVTTASSHQQADSRARPGTRRDGAA